MGVEITTYVMYGFKITDEKELDFFEENYEKADEYIVYMNPMCDGSLAVGKILFQASQYGDSCPVEIDISTLPVMEKEVREYLDQKLNYELKDKFKLFAFVCFH